MIEAQTVRILLVLEQADGGETITWTPAMARHEAHGCLRDWGHAEWYDGSPVGWDPCDSPGCPSATHVLRVKRALIVDQAS